MATQITKNFTLEEFITSATAKAKGIDNTPTPQIKANIEKLCKNILQPIRDKYGYSINITSGYRSPKLNAAVKGAKNSQHMTGDASDFKCKATSKAKLFNLIVDMMKKGEIQFGQLIWEYGTKKEPNWIHISNPRVGKKNNQIIYYYS